MDQSISSYQRRGQSLPIAQESFRFKLERLRISILVMQHGPENVHQRKYMFDSILSYQTSGVIIAPAGIV